VLFVTGFPGFIARRLVASLLARGGDTRVAALVERKMAETARAAAAHLDSERIELVGGDIAEDRLGLSGEDYERLSAQTTGAYHLAAIYDLAVPLEVAQSVNVDGTANVLELCSRCERLERLNYVSTAYVAGTRHGVVYEHELVLGQGFKNHYESTKFQAELWVRERMAEIPTTVYRPAIVVGDSRSGETQKFDGPYYLLRAVSVMERLGLPIAQFGRSAAPFNVVPVDFVVDAMVTAGGDPAAAGETLHLVDPEPIEAAELLAVLSRRYGGREPAYRVPARLVAETLRLGPVRRLFGGAPRESIRYLNHPVRFDARRANEVLGRHGLRCPRFGDYADPIVRFFKDHEDDPALGPRPPG
jgi:thioester reductase-like protein